MDKIVDALRLAYPQLTFKAGSTPQWSPSNQQITYRDDDVVIAVWTLFHELAHALLGHKSYQSDAQLLIKETEAWEKAITIAKAYGEQISDTHIQACLDTYRDWLHKRSTCPQCSSHGVQSSESLYSCLNCQKAWKVTSARFCRPYRLTKALKTN